MYNPALCSNDWIGKFPYSEIPRLVPEDSARAYSGRSRGLFAQLAKVWTRDLNTEWMLRQYFATKMLLTSNLKLAAAEEAPKYGFGVAEPYLIYYGLFHAARSLILLLPHQPWRQGELFNLSHHKIQAIIFDELKNLDDVLATDVCGFLQKARTYRELFSYRIPANGLKSLSSDIRVDVTAAVRMAALLAELAQLNSECLQSALEKHSAGNVGHHTEITISACLHRIGETSFEDPEDGYRIDQLVRRVGRPINLWLFVREGMIEDFFHTWKAESRGLSVFDTETATEKVFPFS